VTSPGKPVAATAVEEEKQVQVCIYVCMYVYMYVHINVYVDLDR